MNFVVMTKGEWQAFALVLELRKQCSASDNLLVWDDFSPDNWVEQMTDLAEVKQDAANRNMGEHRNRVKQHFPFGEWIVMLDADEWVQPGFVESLRTRVDAEPGADVFYLERHNSYWDDTGSVVVPDVDYSKPFRPDYQPRGFRNSNAIRYSGAIHEGFESYHWPLFLRGPPFTLIHHRKNSPRRYADWV